MLLLSASRETFVLATPGSNIQPQPDVCMHWKGRSAYARTLMAFAAGRRSLGCSADRRRRSTSRRQRHLVSQVQLGALHQNPGDLTAVDRADAAQGHTG